MVKVRIFVVVTALTALVAFLVAGGGVSQASPTGRFTFTPGKGRPALSGVADPNLLTKGSAAQAAPANAPTAVLAASDDIQVNGDNKVHETDQFGTGEGLPQNETAIAVNPTNALNVIASANDYEPSADTIQGLYTSFDGGHHWRSRHMPDVRNDNFQIYASGDPAVAFDGDGVAYNAAINFGRLNCDSFVTVSRSSDNGVVWSDPAAQVSGGLLITLGDGVVAHNGGPDDCEFFNDKEGIAAGPRPSGAPLVEGTDPDHVSKYRVYVTWTLYDFGPEGTGFVDAPIYVSYSDDQGRHWSAGQEISGSSSACGGPCNSDTNSHPVVDPKTGRIWAAFENYNTPSTVFNQFMVVSSVDGGQTWSAPVKITNVIDGPDEYPTCFGDQTLDDMCARVDLHTSNIDEAPNGDLWVTWEDNRNGTASNTNADVFVMRSTDGGATWGGLRNLTSNSTDDQFYPWLSVASNGTVAVMYFDRRYSPVRTALGGKFIDTSLSTIKGSSVVQRRVSEVSWNPDLVFRLGFFIGDYNGMDTTSNNETPGAIALPFWTDGRFAEPNTPGNNPPHQQSDVMVDLESIP